MKEKTPSSFFTACICSYPGFLRFLQSSEKLYNYYIIFPSYLVPKEPTLYYVSKQSVKALPSTSFWRSYDRSSELLLRSDDRSSETVWRSDDRNSLTGRWSLLWPALCSVDRSSEESAGQKSNHLTGTCFRWSIIWPQNKFRWAIIWPLKRCRRKSFHRL